MARILLINSIYFLMGFSIWPLITHRCRKFDRWACVSTFQNSVRMEPRRARGATSTAEISKTLRRNPIIFYKIVEGGHIKESWAGFLNRTNIESDAWEVEIEFLVLLGEPEEHAFTLLHFNTFIHFYSLLYFYTLTTLFILYLYIFITLLSYFPKWFCWK